MRRKSTVACAVCALLLALASPSFAQQDDALALYNQGKTLMKNGRRAEAAVAFQGACDKGLAQSCIVLGLLYDEGTGGWPRT